MLYFQIRALLYETTTIHSYVISTESASLSTFQLQRDISNSLTSFRGIDNKTTRQNYHFQINKEMKVTSLDLFK